jgi:hypothetical protein
MTTTHDDNATTWRDLAGELFDLERGTLELLEQRLSDAGVPTATINERLLHFARNDVEARLADNAYSDVPAPAGATYVGDWEKNLKRDGWSRSLIWHSFGDRDVHIDGSQQCDGSYTCNIVVYADRDEATKLDAAGARRLAGLLVEAADAMDAL